jgi:hypothetical protein
VIDECTDRYLQVHSNAKQAKEESMKEQFAQRFDQGLQQIRESIGKKGGAKGYAVVWERIGRLKAKYPSIHRHYDIDVTKDPSDIVTDIKWQRKEAAKKRACICCVPIWMNRTNIPNGQYTIPSGK